MCIIVVDNEQSGLVMMEISYDTICLNMFQSTFIRHGLKPVTKNEWANGKAFWKESFGNDEYNIMIREKEEWESVP